MIQFNKTYVPGQLVVIVPHGEFDNAEWGLFEIMDGKPLGYGSDIINTNHIAVLREHDLLLMIAGRREAGGSYWICVFDARSGKVGYVIERAIKLL